MVVYAFLLSLALSAVFLVSGNLYPPILMHSLINLWGFVAVPVIVRR
jgi:membrane protease YdiL (CAAX protease family)